MGFLSPFDLRRKSDEARYQLLLTSPSLASIADSDVSGYASPLLSADRLSLADDSLDGDGEERRLAAWHVPRAVRRLDVVLVGTVLIALGTGIALFIAFPFPTTVHVFVGAATALTVWCLVSWARVLLALTLALLRGTPRALAFPRWSAPQLGGLVLSTVLVLYWLCLGLVPHREPVPTLGHTDGSQPRYFIAANLYNNEALLPHWSRQLVSLVEHLGPNNTFVSVYESNSNDRTPDLLLDLVEQLDDLGVPNRILSDHTRRSWPYNTSPQRIAFLAHARNKALEPLQSADETLRLHNYATFTKVLFLNDVYFSWQSAVQLLATSADGMPGEDGYDLACGMDFFQSGLYDTWVARDVCGTPMRLVWPYVRDPVSIELLRANRPFPVSACWNGIVAFPAAPYLYRPPPAAAIDGPRGMAKRGWKMIDNATDPDTRVSPELRTPIQFRTSGIEACDHSECFLFSYDLHRLYDRPERPPRILMNPAVVTAYTPKWYAWRTVVLRIPAVQWWQRHWSHGVPFQFVDWIWERHTRKRDYCTWAALATHAPARCPPLPGAKERAWDA